MKIVSENKKTAINLISSIITMGISIAINFFLSPYIVRHLGTEANGFTQLANNFVLYATLITIALNSMAGRFIAIEYHRGKPKEAKAYIHLLLLAIY
jgi:O-antigen/teichoic acid export membrane protein